MLQDAACSKAAQEEERRIAEEVPQQGPRNPRISEKEWECKSSELQYYRADR